MKTVREKGDQIIRKTTNKNVAGKEIETSEIFDNLISLLS
jgi:hypothetical protein